MKKKIPRILGVLLVLSLLLMALPTPVAAATITVPGDHATIQAAIDVAVDGDTIIVADGIYTEDLTVNTPNLTLRSVNGSGSTTIQGVGTEQPSGYYWVIWLKSGATNFTLGGTDGHGFEVLGHADNSGVLLGTTGAPSGVTLSYNDFDTTGETNMAIAVGSGGIDGLNISHNTLDLYKDSSGQNTGIYFDCDPITNLVVDDNTVEGQDSHAAWINCVVNAGIDGAVISNNTVTNAVLNMRMVEDGTPRTNALNDIAITGNTFNGGSEIFIGPGTPTGVVVSNLSVTGNTVNADDRYDRYIGDCPFFEILGPASGNIDWGTVAVTGNNFNLPSSQWAVKNNVAGTTLNAEYNWWGDPAGPSFSPGDGAKVSDNVDYCPWLCECMGNQCLAILEPECGIPFNVSDTFNVVATVENTTGTVQSDVIATLSWDPFEDAELIGGDSADKHLGSIEAGGIQDAQWTLHCLDPGHLTITVSTNYAASCSFMVQQLGNPAIDITITSPPDMTEIGVGQTFDVTATVTNTGLEPLSGVIAWLGFYGGANASVSTGPTYGTWPDGSGELDKGASVDVSWTVDCTGPDDPPLYTEIEAGARGSGTATPGYVFGYDDTSVYQKYLLVEIIEPVDGWHVNVCREFPVHAEVTNHLAQTLTSVEAVISWLPENGAMLEGAESEKIVLPNISPGATAVIPFWHLHCLLPGDLDITVEVTAIEGGPGGPTYVNKDVITIIQQEPAALRADMVTTETCYGISNDFTVTATITNTGMETAIDVWADLGDLAHASIVTGDDPQYVGTLAGDETKTVTWTLHCDGAGNVTLIVTPSGIGFNTGDVIQFDPVVSPGYTDPIPSSPVTIHQLPLTVAITAPLTEELTVQCSDTFSVEAILENLGGSGTLGPVDVTLEIVGSATEVDDETLTKTIGQIPSGETQDVAWTLHCDGPGTVTLKVKAETDWWQDTYQYTYSNEVTVYQESRGYADVSVEIISPDLGAKYATSQEFAVTAVITNDSTDGATVTITNATDVIIDPFLEDRAEVIDSPVFPVDILAGESVTVTWTLHCVGSGPTFFFIYVQGYDEVCRTVAASTCPMWVWQYPAAQLEVEILEVLPDTTVNVSDTFTVRYKVNNTGEADATEVTAHLSVTPEGSARPVAGLDSGFTQSIGTIPGHGQVNDTVYEWTLHCKVPSESTITITAEGYDEYGWHMKQESSSTGSFVIWDGWKSSESLWTFGPIDSVVPSPEKGWSYGFFVGDANGLIGPFNFETDVSFAGMGGGPDITGHEVGMGAVIPNVRFSGPGWDEGDDLLIWVSHYIGDTSMDFMATTDWDVHGGLIQVINGNLTGVFEMYSPDVTPNNWAISLLGGTYHTNMAAQAGLAIPDRFIEDASVTVKQVEPPADADLAVEKLVNGEESITSTVGDEVTFTITVENLGEADATSIWVWDLLPAGVNFESWDVDLGQGFYYVGSGYWSVGDLAVGEDATLTIVATVNTVGEIHNLATVDYCDQHDPITTNNADVAMVTGEAAPIPEPYDEWTIDVDPGWNLVSLPLIPEDPDIVAMTATLAELLAIYGYDPEGVPPDDFPWYYPGAPAGTYPLDEMVDGYGYWVQMVDLGAGGSFTFDGWELVAETDPPSLPPSYAVVEGWNLIGFKSTIAKLAADYLAGIAGKYVMIYGYDGGNFFIVGSAGHEFLQPGLGYWIALIEPGIIYP